VNLRAALRDVFVGDSSRSGTSTLENPSTDLIAALTADADYVGMSGGIYVGAGGSTVTGKTISPARALAIAAVYACVRVLAEDVGSLPLHTFEKVSEPTKDGGSRKVKRRVHEEDDERAFMLGEEPNPELTAQTKWELTTGHMLMWGNGYDYKQRDGAGNVVALWPLPPDRTSPYRLEDGSLVYITADPTTGVAQVLFPDEVIHYRAFGTGEVGISPIGLQRQAWGIALAAEEYAGRFWANNARPGGVLATDKAISDPDYERALRRYRNRHEGLANSSLVALLDNGMKWQDVGIPPGDAQFIETRKFQVREAARAFRVPPYKIADLEAGSVSYKSVEVQQLDYLTSALQPWLLRIEGGVKRGVFGTSADRSRGLFARFQRAALLQGDAQTRFMVYDLAIKNRIMTPNECREREDLPPLDSGDEFPPAAPAMPGAPTPPAPASSSGDDDAEDGTLAGDAIDSD
jgi:HK97 family phage portal protein